MPYIPTFSEFVKEGSNKKAKTYTYKITKEQWIKFVDTQTDLIVKEDSDRYIRGYKNDKQVLIYDPKKDMLKSSLKIKGLVDESNAAEGGVEASYYGQKNFIHQKAYKQYTKGDTENLDRKYTKLANECETDEDKRNLIFELLDELGLNELKKCLT